MASGQTLAIWTPQSNEPPATNFAYCDQRNGSLVLAFSDTLAWSAVFPGILPRNYGGSGVTLRICWVETGAGGGSLKWNAQFERHQDAVADLDSDAFATAKTVTESIAAGMNGVVQYTDIAFSNGSEMAFIAAGESFRVKVTRDAADAGDNLAAIAQLIRLELRET